MSELEIADTIVEAKAVETGKLPTDQTDSRGDDGIDPVEMAESPPTIVTPTPKSNPPSPPKTDVKRRLVDQFTSVTRGRVYSLDRGRDLLTSLDFDGDFHNSAAWSELTDADMQTPRKHNGTGIRTRSPSDKDADDKDEDEEDARSYGSRSSDDESSYFAKNLPSPRSGRRFSYDAGSISSAPARSGFYNSSASSLNRESDASLSFSDDDSVTDEDDKTRSTASLLPVDGRAPVLLPPMRKKSADTSPMYPQRITRVHSANSLVSSESERERSGGRPRQNARAATSPTLASSSSTSTSSIASTRSATSPREGNEDGEEQFVSDIQPRVTAPVPAQMSNFSRPHFVAPPQITPGQMAAWAGYYGVQPGAIPPFPHYFNPDPAGYGSMTMLPDVYEPRIDALHLSSSSEVHHRSFSGGEQSRSVGDSSTIPLVYSDDEDIDSAHMFGRRQADGIGIPASSNGAQPFAGNSHRRSAADQATKRTQVSRNQLERPDGFVGGAVPGSSSLKGRDTELPSEGSSNTFKVYWKRWLMLMYMSILNLLSDWTCYSVAPIAVLTMEAFGQIDPEQLVVVFLGANAVATACEPVVLSRLGLRRTVILGAFLLMVGSMVKSGGLPPIVESTLEKGQGEWRIYLGFFLVGLSQPLYQCTPALLSASWFPERERTLATGVALNANQLGIGFAFIFGTLLVASSDDIVKYFGLLSIISTLAFIGCLFQFDDAPPTPPSDTARAMRGDLNLNIPDAVDTIWRSVRSLGSGREVKDLIESRADKGTGSSHSSSAQEGRADDAQKLRSRRAGPGGARQTRRSSKRTSPRRSSSTKSNDVRRTGSNPNNTRARRRPGASPTNNAASTDSGLGSSQSGRTAIPSPASTEKPTRVALAKARRAAATMTPPSPMMPGPVGPPGPGLTQSQDQDQSLFYCDEDYPEARVSLEGSAPQAPEEGIDTGGHPHGHYQQPTPFPPWSPGYAYLYPNVHHPGYAAPPRYQPPPLPPPSMEYAQASTYYPSQGYYYDPPGPIPQGPYYHQLYANYPHVLDGAFGGSFDDGVEPVVTITPHHLDINIRDDQIILSTRACLSRPGFVHALVSFTVSGIVINTLSTFMDYLVRLNGAGREYVGIVGGSFQFIIMISSLIVGKLTDRTRAYYSVAVGMLVLGAFALAECGVDLDADRGGDLRWALIIVAILVGPLQPVSTELGVEVAYPLSENTVLVIQQLFSNLFSALFIPFFKALKDIGTESVDDVEMYEKPQYTFSFYLLIVIHAGATVFFATFNGRYLRHEQEKAKKAREEQGPIGDGSYGDPNGERQPLNSPVV